MSEYISFLITLFDEQESRLIRCALKAKRDLFNEDCIQYPMEPENKMQFFKLLPFHVRSIGRIVDIVEIFDVEII